MRFIHDFIIGQEGVTAIEYALLATLIAVLIAGAVGSVGAVVAAQFAGLLAAF